MLNKQFRDDLDNSSSDSEGQNHNIKIRPGQTDFAQYDAFMKLIKQKHQLNGARLRSFKNQKKSQVA